MIKKKTLKQDIFLNELQHPGTKFLNIQFRLNAVIFLSVLVNKVCTVLGTGLVSQCQSVAVHVQAQRGKKQLGVTYISST